MTPGYPARPTAGSIMDLDLVDDRCNFGSGKVCFPKQYGEGGLISVCPRLLGTTASRRRLG